MKWDKLQLNNRGFVLLEPVLAGTLLLIVALVITTTLVSGRQSYAAVAERTQALYFAQEGLEAVRNMRDVSFDDIRPGTWGISKEGSIWTLQSDSNTVGIFTRSISIEMTSQDERNVTSHVTWDNGIGEREVVLQTNFTRWR